MSTVIYVVYYLAPGWSNAEFDALIQRAFRSPSQEAHNATLREAERILMEEMPIAPIYYYSRVYLLHPDVRGWYPKLTDNRPYKHLWLQAD